MATTSRQRLKSILAGEVPDCVPVCPDISNMVPCRLTGKPFWDIYVRQDPPLWKAYIDAARRFDIDGGFELYSFGDLFGDGSSAWERRIVKREPDASFYTQDFNVRTGEWGGRLLYHTKDNPPASGVKPETVGLPRTPSEWEALEGVKEWPKGMELWKLIKKEMGEQGIVGMPSGGSTLVVQNEEEIYEYYEDPEKFRRRRDEMIETARRNMETIAGLEERPDFIFCGASGSLIWQTPEMFRELGLPVLKAVAEMAFDLGIPTHVHSCGPESLLVKLAAEETKLSVIDPLEMAPMGDCDLAELKRLYGDRIILKGNLHTTDVMLNGSEGDVVAASKRAMDAAAKGGRFILSTGDQCGRDTPDRNLFAMVESARTYGRY